MMGLRLLISGKVRCIQGSKLTESKKSTKRDEKKIKYGKELIERNSQNNIKKF